MSELIRSHNICADDESRGTAFTPTFVNSTQEVALIIDTFEPRPPNTTVVGAIATLYPDDPSLGSYVSLAIVLLN